TPSKSTSTAAPSSFRRTNHRLPNASSPASHRPSTTTSLPPEPSRRMRAIRPYRSANRNISSLSFSAAVSPSVFVVVAWAAAVSRDTSHAKPPRANTPAMEAAIRRHPGQLAGLGRMPASVLVRGSSLFGSGDRHGEGPLDQDGYQMPAVVGVAAHVADRFRRG